MKIGLINGGGYHNWGDDSQILNAILKLKEKGYKDLLVFSRAKYLKDLLKVPTCNSSHLIFKNCKNDEQRLKKYKHITEGFNNTKNLTLIEKQFIKNIKDIDVLFFAGSGTINTRHLRGLCIFLSICNIAKKLGKKVILSAQGFSPMDNSKYFPMIKETLNLVDYITVRDFDSGIEQLKMLGINKNIIKVCDDAFDYPITTNRFNYLKGKKVVGINVSSFSTPEIRSKLCILALQLKKEGYRVIFNHFQNERELIKKMVGNKFEIVEFNNPSEISEFYNYCKFAIGMRYHSTIFCLSQKVPHINLYINNYQKAKIQAIEKEFGIDFGIDCSNNVLDLYKEFKKIIKRNIDWNYIYKWLKELKYKSVELINVSARNN